jgi:hydroxymethylpyrimidine/phosphomethylpyrimidine kinase
MSKKVALSIAGSDSSGGAGVQADLKSFSFLGVHGTSVITCVTSQNTQGVKEIFKLPVEMIEKQIDVLFEDFTIDAVKTGMLYDEEIVKSVSERVSKYSLKPVVDPVLEATTGDSLFRNDFLSSYKKHLLPKTFMLTANLPEACELTGLEIRSFEDFKKASERLLALGPEYVLIKGGHFEGGDAVDLLYDGVEFHEFSLPRISKKDVHGSGCTLSAIVTGLLALGASPVEAVRRAKCIVWDMIHRGYTPGKGSGVLDHSCEIVKPPSLRDEEYLDVWFSLKNGVEKLISILPLELVPEVGMNFVYARKETWGLEDICGVDGRIFKTKGGLKVCGGIDFGVSKHVASVVLAATSVDKNVRSAVNICYSRENVEGCKKSGLSIGFFKREDEPVDAESTLDWGTKHAVSTLGYVPDVIYDTGGLGKEPMIRILGKNPRDVLSKIQKLLKNLRG